MVHGVDGYASNGDVAMVFQKVVLFGEVGSVHFRVVRFETQWDVEGENEFSEAVKEESLVIMLVLVSASAASVYIHTALELILLSSSLPCHLAGEN
jgi:hypothetical protein